ncbi:SRPBCC family protein [Variovorax sp. ZT5P49]|uniref:SRPBCC family protein n=1 Tax=Variovorax sp. ZT5P49 TaxID=3443733 RepID=UPI003F476156
MINIVHGVGIKAPVSKVYAALATREGVAGWWTKETTGASEVGGNLELNFSTPSGEVIGGIGMQVAALDPDKEVRWRFTSGPEEWIGTDARFKLALDGDFTIVLFSHENWREAVEFTYHCSTKWAIFMMSLKRLVETGKGEPAPHDVQIGNWH